MVTVYKLDKNDVIIVKRSIGWHKDMLKISHNCYYSRVPFEEGNHCDKCPLSFTGHPGSCVAYGKWSKCLK